jgi:hypothetical protein
MRTLTERQYEELRTYIPGAVCVFRNGGHLPSLLRHDYLRDIGYGVTITGAGERALRRYEMKWGISHEFTRAVR